MEFCDVKTPTHGLIGYCLARAMGWNGTRRRCAIIGAVLPDASIILAASINAANMLFENRGYDFDWFKAQMDLLYFSDPVLISSHNFLHSPLNLTLLAALAMIFLDAKMRSPVLAFLAGAASHSVVDLLTHVEDGPLLFWPLDWETRFAGPLSHWEPGSGGALLTLAELGFCLGALFVTKARPLFLRTAIFPR